jgi:hypothetical protein
MSSVPNNSTPPHHSPSDIHQIRLSISNPLSIIHFVVTMADTPPPPAIPTMATTKSTPFEPGNNDLLSRLANFLPQLEAANKSLTKDDNACVDADLEIDSGEDGADDDDDDNSDQSSSGDADEEEEILSPKKMIQIKLAVGDVDENPAIRWLADCDNDNKEKPAGRTEEKKEDENEDASLSVAEGAVRNLLGKRRGEALPAKQGKRGPLITEIDSS